VRTLHSLGLQGGSTEPVLHVLACCQGHHYNGGISHDLDVMEVDLLWCHQVTRMLSVHCLVAASL